MGERHRPEPPAWTWVIVYAVITILALPLVMMVFTSLVERSIDGSWQLTFRFWMEVLSDERLSDSVANSFIVATLASAGAVIIGTSAALALAKTKFIGQTFLKINSILSLVFPEIVFALSLLALFFSLGFELGLETVILAHISFALPYVILTVGARVASLDQLVDDSAYDLGASDWQSLFKIHIPLLRPAIASGFFLSFLLSFDDFLITFFVNGVGKDTLPIKLFTAMKSGITPQLNALATIIFLVSSGCVYFLLKSSTFEKTIQTMSPGLKPESKNT